MSTAKRDIVACSGGKDSTALALLLHEQGVDFDIFWTPTGNEPPDVVPYLERLVQHVGARIISPPAPTLFETIERNRMIPNFWSRFCTRQIKIEPCVKFFRALSADHILHVGLRYDEPERVGIYDDVINRRFLLRELEMDVEDVIGYNADRGFVPPKRTDCMLCPFQGLSDWKWLYERHPEEYRRGIQIENEYGHTFRSPSRDTWPAPLNELSYAFYRGRPIPKKRIDRTVCRACTI